MANMTGTLDQITILTDQISQVKGKCENYRQLMDEGTYKLNAVLNIIDGLKVREQNIMTTGMNPSVIQQMNEEQIDSLLELLKSPAFQSLARQILIKWVAKS